MNHFSILHPVKKNPSLSEISKLIQKRPIALILFLLLLVFSSPLQAQIYEPEGLNLPGSWNSWTNPPTNLAFASSTQVTNGRVSKISVGTMRWQTTIKVAVTGGDVAGGNYDWVFASGSAAAPWGNKWAGVNVAMNTLQNYTYNDGADNNITLTNGKWYTMNWQDQGYVSTSAIFMETSAEPASIQSVTQLPADVSDEDAVTVTITTSATPSAEEKIYVRYSNDSWSTSAVALATFTGTTGTATIPVQDVGVTVSYYVMSTTISNPVADHDMLTIKLNNNGGSNYSYTVTEPICGLHVVSTMPSFPLEGQALALTFNANVGNGALQNYTGDIYIHTGVITNLSSSNADWKYTKTEWGVNTADTKLTRISDNSYSLSIPDIRSYYGVPSGETILKLVMVFRSDGNTPAAPSYLTHKTGEGSDILVNVYENSLQVKLLNPTGNINVVNAEMEIAACATAMNHTQLSLFVNDNLISQTALETWSQLIDLSGYGTGSHWVIAEATDGSTIVRDSIPFYIRGAITVAELPAGVKSGVNYMDNSTVTLVLNDPPALKTYAFAVGDFSDWRLTDDGYMKRTPDGKYYWITLNGLSAGEEYAYQYLIDGNLRLADPYCEKVLDPWNDAYILSTVYPDLKPYPHGQTTGIVSVFEPGQTTYSWQMIDFTPPLVQDLVSYELHIRDFVESGTIKGVGEKLDYLQSLGVNAIELMPINEFEGNDSWGYNPSFYFAADKAYGTRDDYKKFIDECHQRGMAVILDMVLNHSFSQSPLVQMYFDANAGDYGQVAASNPWYNVSSPNTAWSWGYDFNHESIDTKNFIDRVNAYWLNEFNVDGFRFDFTKGFTNTPGEGWNYDPARIAILKRMADQIWVAKPGAYVILEHLTDNSEEKELANYGMLLWGNMSEQYAEGSMGYNEDKKSDLSWGTHTARGFNFHNLVSYMESHDEERMMYKNLTYGNSNNPAHNVKNLNTALSRSGLAAAFYLVTPGPKMIWQFGELGYDFSINHCPDGSISPDCRTSRKPIPWSEELDYYNVPDRKALYERYAELLRLKTNFPVFKTSNFNYSLDANLKRMHLTTDEMKVTLIGNFDVVAQNITPYFQNTGTWYEYFTGEVREVSATTDLINLQPGEYRLYSSTPFYSNYYATSSGNLSDLTSWTSNSNGSGGNPSSFTTANTNYYLVNQSNSTITSDWTLSGANSRLIIGNGVDAVNCTLAADVVADYIIIKANSGLAINPGATLTVNERLLNEAGANKLIIVSDATGTGSLIHSPQGVPATIERYLTKYNVVSDKMFHYISSPVAAQPIRNEFLDLTSDEITDFYSFDEPKNVWKNARGAASYNSWNDEFGGDNFSVGKGYMVAYPEDVIKTFTGTLNSTEKVLTATNTPTTGSGWNLLGNPFPSAIDWNGVTLGAGMDNALYYYDNATQKYMYYIKIDDANIGDGSQYIPAMQGFMVHASAASATVTIPLSARIHESQNVFYKSTNAIPGSLSLKVATNGYEDEAFIHFNQSATTAFDGNYDAYKLKSYSDKVPMIYTKGSDGNELAINGLPELDASTVIPVFLDVATEGAYTLTANLDGLPNAVVNLVDIKLNKTQNLKENPSYSFTASKVDEAGRFKLTFTSVGIDKPEAAEGVQVYAFDNVLYVKTSANETALVNVYNLTGQLVMQGKTGGDKLSTFNASALGNGVYVVNVIHSQGVVSQKVVIRK